MDRLLRKLGLGKGRLDLDLNASEYYLGDWVDGVVTYELKKPEEGTGLWVEVRASQSVSAPREVYREHLRGRPRREVENRTSTFTLYEKRLQLDGHHLYDIGSHDFRIPLPEAIASPRPDQETPFHSWSDWGKPRGLVHFSRIKWQVRAKLVIPWSLGVSDRKTLYVKERAPGEVGPTSAPPRPTGKNFCGGCGTQRAPGDHFCSRCGRKF